MPHWMSHNEMIRYLAYCDKCSDELGTKKDSVLRVLRKLEIGPDLWPLLNCIGIFQRKVKVEGREMGIYDQLVRYRFIRRTVTDVNRYAYLGTVLPDMPYAGSAFNVLGLEELLGSPSPFSLFANFWKDMFEEFDITIQKIVNGIIDNINEMVEDALDKCKEEVVSNMKPGIDQVDDILKELKDVPLINTILGNIPTFNKNAAENFVKDSIDALKDSLKIAHVELPDIQDLIVFVTVRYVIPFMAWWRDLWVPVKLAFKEIWEAIEQGILGFLEKLIPTELLQYFGKVKDTIKIWIATFKHYFITMFKELIGIADIIKELWHQIDKLFVAVVNTCWYCGRNNVPIPDTFSDDQPSQIPLFHRGVEIEFHDVNLKLELKDITLPNPFPQDLIDAANWLKPKIKNSAVKSVLNSLGYSSKEITTFVSYVSGSPPANRIKLEINEEIELNIPAAELTDKNGIQNPIIIGDGLDLIQFDLESKKVKILGAEKDAGALKGFFSIYEKDGHQEFTDESNKKIHQGTVRIINPNTPINANTIKRLNPDFPLNGRPYLETDDTQHQWYRYKSIVKDEKFVKVIDKSTESGVTQWKVFLHPYQDFIDKKGKITLRYLDENGNINTKSLEVVKPNLEYPEIPLEEWVFRYAEKYWTYMPFPLICPFCGSTTSIIKVLMGAAESERADMIHTNRSGEFQVQLFRYIYDHQSELSEGELEDLKAIAYGSMGHYVHDIVCHPLVNAIGGSYRATRCKYCGGNLVATPLDPDNPSELRYFCEYEGCPINQAINVGGDLTVDDIPEDPMDVSPNLLADSDRRVEGLAMHGWIETIWDVWVFGNFHHRLNNKVISLIESGYLGNFEYLNNDYKHWSYPGIDMNKTILKSDFIWSGDDDDNEDYISGLSNWVHLQDYLDPLGPDMIDPANYSTSEEEKNEINDKSVKLFNKHGFNSAAGFWLGRTDAPEGNPYSTESSNPIIDALFTTYSTTYGKLSTWKRQWSGDQDPMVVITEDETEGKKQLLYDYVGTWAAHGLRGGAVLSAPKYQKIMKKKYLRAFLTEIDGEPFSAIHGNTYVQRFMQSVLLLARFIKAGEEYLDDGDLNKFRNAIGNFNMDSGYEVRLLYKKVVAPPAADKTRPVIRFQHIWNRTPEPIGIEECETEGPPGEEEVHEPTMQILEVEDALFHHDSGVILPEKPSGPSSEDGAEPSGEMAETSGISIVSEIYDFVEENPEKQMIIAGHTDTTGQAKYNFQLSSYRAKSLLYLVVGEKDNWAENSNKKNKVEDYQQILKHYAFKWGWDCDPGAIDNVKGPGTTKAVRNFQKTYNDEFGQNIGVDGSVGKQTWGAIFDCYVKEIADMQGTTPEGLVEIRNRIHFVSSKYRVLACGESAPIEAAEFDNYRSQINRRVEVLFFDPGEAPALACPPPDGPYRTEVCDMAGCPIYQKGKYKRKYVEPKPEPKPTVPPPPPTKPPETIFESDLKILTQNVMFLPEELEVTGNVKYVSERRPAVVELLKEFDIISCQEVFDDDSQDYVVRGWYNDVLGETPEWIDLEESILEQKKDIIEMSDRGVFDARPNDEEAQMVCDKHFLMGPDQSDLDQDGGLVIFSKYPIIKSSAFVFSESAALTSDYMANKGVLYARINVTPEGSEKEFYVHVFNTHTQAGNEPQIREVQFEEFKKFIEKCTEHDGYPILLMGDFNVESGTDEYTRMNARFAAMKFVDVWRQLLPAEPGHTWTGEDQSTSKKSPYGDLGNVLAVDDGLPQRLDYYYHFIGEKILTSVASKIETVPESKEKDKLYCFDNDESCNRIGKDDSCDGLKSYTVSDHIGLNLELHIKEIKKEE